jgi:hypothetical protein
LSTERNWPSSLAGGSAGAAAVGDEAGSLPVVNDAVEGNGKGGGAALSLGNSCAMAATATGNEFGGGSRTAGAAAS